MDPRHVTGAKGDPITMEVTTEWTRSACSMVALAIKAKDVQEHIRQKQIE